MVDERLSGIGNALHRTYPGPGPGSTPLNEQTKRRLKTRIMSTDFISIFYLGEPPDGKNLLGKDQGFTVRYGRTIPPDYRPDVILVDLAAMAGGDFSWALKWVSEAGNAGFRFMPALFLAVDRLPAREDCLRIFGDGYDEILIHPLDPREIRFRAGVYIKQRELAQAVTVRERKLEKAFDYLNRFKRELRTVKTELIREKTSLNNALKQIHHMTRERRLLKRQLHDEQQAFRRNMDGFGELLSTLIRHRVERNRGHQERVAHAACFVARQMGLDEKKLEDLGKAAMLHEVGLLFMPEYRGDKRQEIEDGGLMPGPNPESEIYRRDMQIQYPVKGADLLARCQGFEKPAQIIRYMNENADGTGYPEGLKKRHIPVLSRILAGADAMDTLKDSDAVQSLEGLFAALESVSGSRLDPVIVNWLEKYAVIHMGSDAYQVRGVGVEQLEPGMQLVCALFTSTGTKLFSANTLLTKEAIDKIMTYNREYPVDETVYIKA